MSATLSTKEKILNIASKILQDRGYNGFSYSHISKQLGIRNAAIHYHFPTKSDLGNAMIQAYQNQFTSWMNHNEQKFAGQYDKLLESYIAIPRSFINKQHTVCPLAVLEANYTIFPEGMQTLTQQLSKDIRAWFTRILSNGRTAGIFKFEGPAENKALMLSAALQGASMMAHVESPEIFESTVLQIKRELGIYHE
ncbi:MAG: TetR/AcrR family transcriptional regulator [Gammaproteobacteria bacterium]